MIFFFGFLILIYKGYLVLFQIKIISNYQIISNSRFKII